MSIIETYEKICLATIGAVFTNHFFGALVSGNQNTTVVDIVSDKSKRLGADIRGHLVWRE